MPITPMFAALLGLMYIALSLNVIRLRLKGSVSLGSAGNENLEKAIRIHGNFAEYVPFSLIMLWFLEHLAMSSGLVFGLCILLLVSRISHFMGMLNPISLMIFRKLGMIGTFLVILITSLSLLWFYVPLRF